MTKVSAIPPKQHRCWLLTHLRYCSEGSRGRYESILQGASRFGRATLRHPLLRRPGRCQLKAGLMNQTLKTICKTKMEMKILAISLNTKGVDLEHISVSYRP